MTPHGFRPAVIVAAITGHVVRWGDDFFLQRHQRSCVLNRDPGGYSLKTPDQKELCDRVVIKFGEILDRFLPITRQDVLVLPPVQFSPFLGSSATIPPRLFTIRDSP